MRRIARRSLPFGLTAAVALPLLLPAAGQSAAPAADAKVLRGLERLVAAPGGPPGAIATLHRGGKTTVLRAGRAVADLVPDAAHLAAAALHPRLRNRAGSGTGGAHDVPEPERRLGIRGDRLDTARPRRVHTGLPRAAVLRRGAAA